jgi:hypothetical protein
MSSKAKITKILTAVAVAFLFCSSALADDVLYSLPETSGSGVNATPNQTNTAYNICQDFGSGPPTDYCTGYSFGGDVTNTSSLTWNVSSLTVWVVDNENLLSTPSGSLTEPTEFASGLQLVGTPISGSGPVFGAAAAVATTGYSVTPAPYSDSSNGTNYYSPFTEKYDGVWQVSFNVTGLTIGAGEDYFFAVLDPANTSNVSLNATLCSGATAAPPLNACVSNGIVVMDPSNNVVGAYNYANGGASSDVDVEVDGTATTVTPEPTTWLLFGGGIGVLALVRRRRR